MQVSNRQLFHRRRTFERRLFEKLFLIGTLGYNILEASPGSCNDSFANHYEEKSSRVIELWRVHRKHQHSENWSKRSKRQFSKPLQRKLFPLHRRFELFYKRYNSCVRNNVVQEPNLWRRCERVAQQQ